MGVPSDTVASPGTTGAAPSGSPARARPSPYKAVDGAHRPPGMRQSGEKRTGEAGGFREFDSSEDERRKRRALEERAAVAERKAERKKCEYCKRASCIC